MKHIELIIVLKPADLMPYLPLECSRLSQLAGRTSEMKRKKGIVSKTCNEAYCPKWSPSAKPVIAKAKCSGTARGIERQCAEMASELIQYFS